MTCVGERQHSRCDSYKLSPPQPRVEPACSAPLRRSGSPVDAAHEASHNVSGPTQAQDPESRSPQRPNKSSRPSILNRGSSYGTPYSPGGFSSTEEAVSAQTLSWIPSTPYIGRRPRRRLEKPVAIPQMGGRGSSKYMPFTRAYSPVLQAHDVHVEEFIAFVDDLAFVQAPLPPFQTVGIVGMGITFVPHHWSKLVENDASMAANAGSTATSRSRMEKYLKEANQRYFAPRGLKVRIVRDSELAQLVGFPDSLPSLRKAHPHAGSQAPREPEFCILDGYISPLIYDIPPPAHSKNLLDRVNAKKVDAHLARPYKKACKGHYKNLVKLEPKRNRRASAVSICSLSSSSESETDSDSEAASKSKSDQKTKPELEVRNIGLDFMSEISNTESKNLKQAHTIEERRPKSKELTAKQHSPEQLKSTFTSHDRAQGHAANPQRVAENQVKNLMWIFIDNIESDRLPQQD